MPGVSKDLETFTMGTETYVISSGLQSVNLRYVARVTVDSSMFFFSAHSDVAGISVYEVSGDGSMSLLEQQGLSEG